MSRGQGWPGRRRSGPFEHAEPDGVNLPPAEPGGIIVVQAEPDEDDVDYAFTDAFPSPLPAKMAYEILAAEYRAMREAHDRLGCALEVMKKTLQDAKTRKEPNV